MSNLSQGYATKLKWLLAIHLLVRLIVVFFTNLGVDEAYYFTYALLPGLSYFDHPPMVGLTILLSTFNLHFTSEFFMRLGPLVLGTGNLVLIYHIGRQLYNEKAGFFAALLASASVYSSIIAGTFILPDAPLAFFWLLSLFFVVQFLKSDKALWLYLFAVAVGLGMLSKYQAFALWGGFGLYVLFYKRSLLQKAPLYLAALVSLAIFSPVLIWNLQNSFSSFAFHSARVGFDGIKLHWFAQELFGQIAYNNPLNFVLIVICMVYAIRHRFFAGRKELILLLFMSIPLIFIALSISLTSRTLPHWSGAGYYGLILIAAVVLAHFDATKIKAYYRVVMLANVLMIAIVLAGAIQINFGLLPQKPVHHAERLGRNDFSLDMYGWDQAAEKLYDWVGQRPNNRRPVGVISRNWFPGGHLTYYFSHRYGLPLWVYGSATEQHHYLLLNQKTGTLKAGSHAVYVTSSNYYRPLPDELVAKFELLGNADTLTVYRAQKPVYHLFVFELISAKTDIDFSDEMP